MYTKELRDSIIEKLNKKELNFLGEGIARKVYALDENLVVKVEDSIRQPYHKMFTNEQKKESLLKQIEDKIILDDCFIDFKSVFKFNSDEEAVESYIQHSNVEQSLNEYLSWKEIEDNAELSEHIGKVYDIFLTDNSIVIVQERGIALGDNYGIDVDFEEIKNDEFKEESDLYLAIDEMESLFFKEGYYLSDTHVGNFIISQEGKLKMCDLGFTCFNK